MGSRKCAIRVLAGSDFHREEYDGADGNHIVKDIRTQGPFGDMDIKSGGSVYIATLTLACLIATPHGDVVFNLEGAVARIKVDGVFVIEPKLRKPAWFPAGSTTSRRGGFVWNLLGDGREVLGKLALEAIPELRELVTEARKQLASLAA